jgi:hypothetical protein
MTKLSILKDSVGSDLGRPSKMPGYAWGISATLCNIGSKLRVFDSGDLQSEAMLRDWIWIAEQLPDIQFWLPTKEYALIDGFMGTLPDNFVIRVSSPKIDMVPLKAYKFTSTVHDKSKPHGFVCRAYERDGKCGDCRACWSRLVSNVSYPKH